MSTLIFDIETVGEEWDLFDETTQSVLTRWIDKTADSETTREAKLEDLKNGLGFSPLTGRVVAIGLYDLERAQGVVFYDTDGTEAAELDCGEYVLKPRTEAAMLRDFWEGARSYDTFVTFNGRGFDVPFLTIRSIVHGITPTRDLMDGRYLSQQRDARHIDLQDQLSFMERRTAENRSTSTAARSVFRVPKKKVYLAMMLPRSLEGKYEDIARYNARDVTATTELFLRWREHLAPRGMQEES